VFVGPSNLPATGSMHVATAGWRPMTFRRRAPERTADLVCEPVWGGRRVLIDVVGGRVGIRGMDGVELGGNEALRMAIDGAARAGELLLDGSLVPAPLPDARAPAALVGIEAVETPADRIKRMLVGKRSLGPLGVLAPADQPSQPRRGDAPAGDSVAFVATDLLWLDGQSLLDIPLMERKRLLDSALEEGDLVRRTMIGRPPFDRWLARWRAMGFDEVIFKAANGRYRPGGLSEDWSVSGIPRR
jgi:ATP-dependent DNA ligase